MLEIIVILGIAIILILFVTDMVKELRHIKKLKETVLPPLPDIHTASKDYNDERYSPSDSLEKNVYRELLYQVEDNLTKDPPDIKAATRLLKAAMTMERENE